MNLYIITTHIEPYKNHAEKPSQHENSKMLNIQRLFFSKTRKNGFVFAKFTNNGLKYEKLPASAPNRHPASN